jgi:hypothetical protein
LEKKIMGSSLVVDFHGPIAFRVCKDVAWAYLPRCKDHDCNILTDSNDISPSEKQTYSINGPSTGSQKTVDGAPVISWPWDTKWEPSLPGKCYCIFRLPHPDNIFGLNAELVEITRPDGGGWHNKKYARGLRFYYGECKHAPQIAPAPSTDRLDATYFQANAKDVQYRIEIRFHDRNKTEYPPYADASMCSATMRGLFPPLNKWIVRFRHTTEITILPEAETEIVTGSYSKTVEVKFPGGVIEHIVDKHAVDCGANTLLFDDGGLTVSKESGDK